MEHLIQQLQTLLDEIEYESLSFEETKEKLQEIVEDANNSIDTTDFSGEENY